ncbi:MAG: hypothetical protein SCM11_15680 [Bacillota bacterium]|nr:hypothetical protein [Bacillota bacterium]
MSEMFVTELFHRSDRQSTFVGIDQEVSLDDDLVVQSVNGLQRVVVSDQPADPAGLFLCQSDIREQNLRQGRAFFFLQWSGCAAIFGQTRLDADVMGERGQFDQLAELAVVCFLRCDQAGSNFLRAAATPASTASVVR